MPFVALFAQVGLSFRATGESKGAVLLSGGGTNLFEHHDRLALSGVPDLPGRAAVVMRVPADPLGRVDDNRPVRATPALKPIGARIELTHGRSPGHAQALRRARSDARGTAVTRAP